MAGYTRNDTPNNIADGNIIDAADLDGEFDAIEDAFDLSTGHTHDGSTGNGGPITRVGPNREVVVTATTMRPATTEVLDLGSSSFKYKDAYLFGDLTVDQVLVNDGAVATPSFSFQNDTNTGLYRIGADSIGVTTNGTLRLTIDNNFYVTADTQVRFDIGGAEKYRITTDGAIGIGGANYGSSGAVLVSGGSGTSTSWKNTDASPIVSVEAGTTFTFAANTHHFVTNASATTGTLPLSPADGDTTTCSIANGRTDNVVARAGGATYTIMDLAENMTIDSEFVTFKLRYVSSLDDWRIM